MSNVVVAEIFLSHVNDCGGDLVLLPQSLEGQGRQPTQSCWWSPYLPHYTCCNNLARKDDQALVTVYIVILFEGLSRYMLWSSDRDR